MTQAVHALHPGVPVVPTQEAGATDGIFFRAAGIPTVRRRMAAFIKDSDAYAHGLNERMPVKSFYEDLQVLVPAGQSLERAEGMILASILVADRACCTQSGEE